MWTQESHCAFAVHKLCADRHTYAQEKTVSILLCSSDTYSTVLSTRTTSRITKETFHARRTPLTAAAETRGSEVTYRKCLPGFTSLCRSSCEVSLS